MPSHLAYAGLAFLLEGAVVVSFLHGHPHVSPSVIVSARSFTRGDRSMKAPGVLVLARSRNVVRCVQRRRRQQAQRILSHAAGVTSGEHVKSDECQGGDDNMLLLPVRASSCPSAGVNVRAEVRIGKTQITSKSKCLMALRGTGISSWQFSVFESDDGRSAPIHQLS